MFHIYKIKWVLFYSIFEIYSYFILRIKLKHKNENYNYNKTNYNGLKYNIIISCKKHGDF